MRQKKLEDYPVHTGHIAIDVSVHGGTCYILAADRESSARFVYTLDMTLVSTNTKDQTAIIDVSKMVKENIGILQRLADEKE